VVAARRALVVAWLVLGIAGALDHTVAESLFGRRFDLVLPHLKYGHVMFNQNPRQVTVLGYLAPDGARRDLADLMGTPAIGYARARLAINVMFNGDYLVELCLRVQQRDPRELTFVVDDWDLDADAHRPAATHRFRCDAHGLAPL
jgi:hypothetical protein